MPTALIVDDEPMANTLLSTLVGLRGYRTIQAYTAGQAAELANLERPDLILLDLMLPDRHGLELCRDLINDPRTADIPIVVISASLLERNREQSLAAGAVDYVPKPYTPDDIFDMLAAVAERRPDSPDGGND